jgi:predicted secreted hydrolase
MTRLPTLAIAAALVTGCAGGGPILANPPAPRPSIPLPTPAPVPARDPLSISLPRDDGPHDRLMEWWYYTGHLEGSVAGSTAERQRFGFEFVAFRAERGTFPTLWASNLAITDETGQRFHYAQRLDGGDGVDRSPRTAAGTPTGLDLALTGIDPTNPATFERPAWRIRGSNGTDRLDATLAPEEAAAAGVPALGLELAMSSRKPPALHDNDGWIDFGAAGGSYYYSRTAMDATGTLTLGDATFSVDGDAWFDHQWGDYISIGAGGWDWFGINLADGTDLTLWRIRDADGAYPMQFGTVVDQRGSTRYLDSDDFVVSATGRWRSPATGAIYPAGWGVSIPGDDLAIDLQPTVADQELDTSPTIGVVYWEGSQRVRARRGDRAMGGEAYVELVGYAPASVAPAGATPPGLAP